MRLLKSYKQHVTWVLSLFSLAIVALQYRYTRIEDGTSLLANIDRFVYHEVLLPSSRQLLPASVPIVIVEINDDDLKRYGSWPWSREQQALGIEALERAQPKLLAMSLIIDPNRRSSDGGDQRLFNAFKQMPQLVAGFSFDFTSRTQSTTELVGWLDKGELPETNIVRASNRPGEFTPVHFPYKRPLAYTPTDIEVVHAAQGLGFLEYDNPQGLLVYPTLAYFNGQFYKSYPLAIAEAFAHADSTTKVQLVKNGVENISINGRTVQTFKDGTILLRPYRDNRDWGNRPFPTVSFSDLVRADFDTTQLKDKIVIYDLTASLYSQISNYVQDSITTRATIQATATANLINDDYIRRDQRANVIEIILTIVAIVGVWWVSRHLSAFSALLATFGVLPAIIYLVAFMALAHFKLWVLISYPLFGIVLSFPLQFGYKHLFEDRQRRMVERALTGYTSKAVMDSLIERGESFLTLPGERRDLTILLFDIKGFTQLSHRLTPEEIFKFLNKVFSLTDQIIIEQYHGMIDKKMGDACIALFGLDGGSDHPLRAVKAALAIQETLFDQFAELTKLAHKESFGPSSVQVRVGISTGTVCLGNVGSTNHYNFTAVGEVVNLCQRLETACTPGEVFVSEETYKRLQNQIDAEPQHAQGKRDEEFYLAYRVLGIKPN